MIQPLRSEYVRTKNFNYVLPLRVYTGWAERNGTFSKIIIIASAIIVAVLKNTQKLTCERVWLKFNTSNDLHVSIILILESFFFLLNRIYVLSALVHSHRNCCTTSIADHPVYKLRPFNMIIDYSCCIFSFPIRCCAVSESSVESITGREWTGHISQNNRPNEKTVVCYLLGTASYI